LRGRDEMVDNVERRGEEKNSKYCGAQETSVLKEEQNETMDTN
jgi:hypothetical protein